MRIRSLVALAGLVLAAPAAADDFVDGIAAQVGTDIVLVSEVERFAAPMEQKMESAGAPRAEIARMRAELLERMIERRLLEQAVRRTEIDAGEGEVDAAIDAIAEENGITREQVRASVEQQGLSWEGYREQIRSEIRRQKLVSAMVHSQIRIEDKELRELYERRYADQPEGGAEVHLRHILVPFNRDDDAAEREACGAAQAALARVRAGEPFEAVAREVSVVNPEFGGDVGWVHAGSVAGWMREPVESLAPGEASPVIRTRFGCNVLMLEERRSFEPVSFQEAKPQLYRELFDEKMAEEYAAFIEQLREQTYIERKGVFAETTPSLTEPPYGTESALP